MVRWPSRIMAMTILFVFRKYNCRGLSNFTYSCTVTPPPRSHPPIHPTNDNLLKPRAVANKQTSPTVSKFGADPRPYSRHIFGLASQVTPSVVNSLPYPPHQCRPLSLPHLLNSP